MMIEGQPVPILRCHSKEAGFAREGAVLVVNSGDSVLMQLARKNIEKGIYADGARAFPSETYEYSNEPDERAIARILHEEHGIDDVTSIPLFGRLDQSYFSFPFISPNGHTPPDVWRARVFIAHTDCPQALQVRRPSEEVVGSEFVSWQEVMADLTNRSAFERYRQLPSTLAIAEEVYKRGFHIARGSSQFIMNPII